MNRAGANAVNLHHAVNRSAVSPSGGMNAAHLHRAVNHSAVSPSGGMNAAHLHRAVNHSAVSPNGGMNAAHLRRAVYGLCRFRHPTVGAGTRNWMKAASRQNMIRFQAWLLRWHMCHGRTIEMSAPKKRPGAGVRFLHS